jgi:quercetin dioxygenase-like cupin family protein
MAYEGQTLENPASGERITFRRTAAQTDGELVAIELELPPGRRVPGPLHIHPEQEERFEVVDGTMRFRIGRKEVIAGPGEVVVVAAGVPHDFANVADTVALVGVEVRPALQMERLFETAVALAREGRTMLGGIPKPLELALLTHEFRREVQAAFPPPWVQRPALAPLAWVAAAAAAPVPRWSRPPPRRRSRRDRSTTAAAASTCGSPCARPDRRLAGRRGEPWTRSSALRRDP